MKPFFQDDQITQYQGDCLQVLKSMEAELVQCVVTSPPYWGLRDYGVKGQLGLEKMVDVFREVRRVLKKDGVCWLNLGDSYGSGSRTTQNSQSIANGNRQDLPMERGKQGFSKQVVGIPWRVAFALQSDGWWLRQDIIWSKPNPMPESVTDRCTKAHEYIFLLTKSAKYFYDTDAVKEPLKEISIKRNKSGWNGNEDRNYINGPQNHMSKYLGSEKAIQATDRNLRSVWTITTQPTKEAHFATFPEKLVETCIKAGSRIGDTILDPFSGSGTTLRVARRLNRKAIGIELKPDYIEISDKFIKQGVLF